MALSASMPFATKKRPPSSGMDSVVRFSDVAQFVGLSLLRDPALARPKVQQTRKIRKSPKASLERLQVSPEEAAGLPPEARAKIVLDQHATEQLHRHSSPGTQMPEVDLPLVPAERSDQLRTQLQWLRAERRAEQEELRKLEVSLSDAMLAERRASQRAAKHREMRDFHRKRNVDVEQKMVALQEELRAGERAARHQDMYQGDRQATPGSAYGDAYGDTGDMSQSQPASPSSPVSPAASSQAWHSYQATPKSVGMPSPAASQSFSQSDRRSPAVQHSASAPALVSAQDDSGNFVRGTETPSAANGNFVRGAETPSAASGNFVRGSETPGAASAASPSGQVVRSSSGTALQERPDSSKDQRSAQSTLSTSPGKNKVTSLPMTLPPPLEDDDYSQNPDEDKREAIRRKMVSIAGGCKQAFRRLDVNASGCISLGDFAAGLSRLGVNWKHITGYRRERDIFKLFDLNRDGAIDLFELFPEERNPPPGEPPSTPDFWRKWCHENKDVTKDAEREKARLSKWQPDGPEEELAVMQTSTDAQAEVALKKKWMKSTIRRLKSRGKSDARCREIVALHLPKGTGPKDREDVPTFSKAETKMIKRVYMDAVNDPARNIQKELYEMRDQRRILQTSRQKLYSVAMEPVIRQQQDQERKNLAMGLGALNLLGKTKDPILGAAEPVEEESSSFNALSKRCENMDVDQIEDVFRVWMRFADKTEVISKHGFAKMLEDMNPKRTFVPNDVHAWWDQVQRMPGGTTQQGEMMIPGADKAQAAGDSSKRISLQGQLGRFSMGGGSPQAKPQAKQAEPPKMAPQQGKRKVASFDQFIVWYSSSEMRIA